ncbi:tetratricopeptide repeat protein [Bacillus alkalicellulosilyticus]|uniref:tetratricopeptide repeat protein n=1 Tax=Alkalihalobacterium alkalicellulosilyticum TaxID=1912214 RepID=UPI001482ABB3|nr:tetratricopeptide repeat protein [Bacillus alkalicellulosilyticus]
MESSFNTVNSLYSYLKNNWQLISEKERKSYVESLEKASESLLDNWVEIDEKINTLKEQLSEFEGEEPYTSKGTSFFELNMFEEASREFENELKSVKTPIVRLYLAYSYLYSEDLEKSKEMFIYLIHSEEKAIYKHFAYVGLGCLAVQQEQNEEAIVHFEKALTLTKNVDVVYNLGMCHYMEQRPQLAIPYFEQVLTSLPEDGESYYFLGKCHFENNQFQLAYNSWLTALQVVETRELLFTLAFDFEWIGLHSMAIHCYKRLQALGYDDDTIIHGLAWNYGLLDDREKAKELFLPLLAQSNDKNIILSFVWLLSTWGEEKQYESIMEKARSEVDTHPLFQKIKHLH